MSNIDLWMEDDGAAVVLCCACNNRPAGLPIACDFCLKNFALCEDCAEGRRSCPHCGGGKRRDKRALDERAGQELAWHGRVERDVEEKPPVTLGLVAEGDKTSLEAFLVMLNDLSLGIDALTGQEGLDFEIFMQRVAALEDLLERIRALLAKSAPIQGAHAYANEDGDDAPTALYGLIRDYDGCLLHASFVLLACHELLGRSPRHKRTKYPEAPKAKVSCPYSREELTTVAKGGRIIVRLYKKHFAYQQIWAGKKWISGKLSDNLGIKGQTKAAAAEARAKMNPIQELSGRNIERLKVALLGNALHAFDLDLVEERRALIARRIVMLERELLAAQTEFLEAQRTLAAYEARRDAEMLTDEFLRELDELGEKCDSARLKVEQLQRSLELARQDRDDRPALRGMGVMPDEFELFVGVIDLPFTIKHATPNWYCVANDGSLDSLVEFQRKNPGWKSEFSTPGNVAQLGNHGFVFFRVDVGFDPIVTRYGATQVMDDLDVLMQDGWISLFDQLKPLSSKTIESAYDHEGTLIRHVKISGTNGITHTYEYGRIPASLKTQANSFSATNMKKRGSERYAELDRVETFSDYVFHGRDIRLGLALSLLFELRMFQKCGYRDHLLLAFSKLGSKEERALFLKTLIGQLFRPEGKYPVALRFTEHPVDAMTVINPIGDGRWRVDGVGNPAIMNDVKIIQRMKFVKEALAQARKTAAAHELNAENAKTKTMQADQLAKAEVRKKELAAYQRELPELEKAYAGIAQRNPHLVVDDEAAARREQSRGLGLERFVKQNEERRSKSSLLLASRGELVRDSQDRPATVRYPYDKEFTVEQVPDDGNCFFSCCAAKKGGTAATLRERLKNSRHLADSERVRVGKQGEYATMEDIEAMARELDLTICVHKCSQAGSRPTPVIVHVGSSGDELHVLFLYNPMDGLGHIMPMRPGESLATHAEPSVAFSPWSSSSSLSLSPSRASPQIRDNAPPQMPACDVCRQRKDTVSLRCSQASCQGHFYMCRGSSCQQHYFRVRDATGDGMNKCKAHLEAAGGRLG